MHFLGINFRSYIGIVSWILLTLSAFKHTHAFFRSTFHFRQQQQQRPPSTTCTAPREYYGGSEEDKNGFFSYAVKYEMTPLPDSLMDTTIFVGNLGDFVTEDTLSRLFATVSTLQTVPSAVARKPNNYSMGYGFVTFTTLEEKEVRRFQLFYVDALYLEMLEFRQTNYFISYNINNIIYDCSKPLKCSTGITWKEGQSRWNE